MPPLSTSQRPSGLPVRISARSFVPWILVVCVIALFGCIRWRLLDVPLERDEGEYAYTAQLMLQGIPPYKLAYNMKLPGTFVAYALSMALFGQTIEGIRIGLLLANAATIALVFLLARRLFDARSGVIACASYALLSTSPSVLGIAAHANHFVVLFAVAGLVMLLRALDSGKYRTLLASGLFFGLAFLMKQHGLVFGLYGAAWLAWSTLKKGAPSTVPSFARKLLIFVSGCAFPFFLTCLILWQAGVFTQFWFWTFTYAAQYATHEPLRAARWHFLRGVRNAVPPNEALWAVAAIGLALLLPKKLRWQTPFVIGLLIFSAAGFAAGFYFRQHYFILLLPAVSLLIAAAAHIGVEIVRRLRLAVLIVVAAAHGFVLFQGREIFFFETPNEVSRLMYGDNPFVTTVEIAQFIRENTSADDKIAVLGSEPQIYFYARRHSATGYIYTYPLVENHPFALKMQREMIAEIENERPAFLVFVGLTYSWVVRPDSDRTIFQWFEEFSGRYYEMVASLDYGQQDGAETKTDGEPRPYINIFKRK